MKRLEFEGLAGPLSDAAQVALEVVNPGGWPPIDGILLQVENGQVRFTGHDLDASASSFCDVTVTARDTVLVDAKLAQVLGQLGPDVVVRCMLAEADPVLGEETQYQLAVSAGDAQFKLGAPTPDKYPEPLNPAPPLIAFSLTAAEWRHLFGTTEYAIYDNAVRYYLCGTYLHVVGDRLVAVATTSHMLASASIPCPAGCEALATGVIIPEYIGRARINGDVVVRMDRRIIQVTTGAEVRASKLIDGTFPDYTKVIPQPSPKFFVADRAALIAAVERIAMLPDLGPAAIRLVWDTARVTVSSQSGGAIETLPCTAAEGGVFGVNAAYLVRILVRNFGGRTVRLDQAAPDLPIRMNDPDDDATFAIIMPMMLRGTS